jgi:hypothetical protein
MNANKGIISNNPIITRTPYWTPDSVRTACIKNDLYTLGDSEAYTAMLERVNRWPNPSDYGLYVIAKDIAEHSEHQPITNVMFILANTAITYTFALDGRGDV